MHANIWGVGRIVVEKEANKALNFEVHALFGALLSPFSLYAH